jgi:hypothetical protein
VVVAFAIPTADDLSYAGWVVFGRPVDVRWFLWLKHEWPYAAKSAYASGSIFHLRRTPSHRWAMAFPFFVIVGLDEPYGWRARLPPSRCGCRSRRGSAGASPSRIWRWQRLAELRFLIAAIPLMIPAVHSLLYWLG